MLPPTVGDEQLSDLLRSLPQHAETLDRVVDTLFSLPSRPENMDADEIAGTPSTGQASVAAFASSIVNQVSPYTRHDLKYSSAPRR